MYKSITIVLLFLGIITVASCEKDDICVDNDTPLLVIRFYDQEDTAIVKAVPSLEVRGINADTLLGIWEDDEDTFDSIAIPLRVDQGNSTFIFSTNATDDATAANIDTVTISYVAEEIFFSRGCGYIVNYNDLSANTIADDSLWINEIRLVTPLIENSTSAHVKILH
ncbi:DUF6452 family protein [Maribacter sp. 2-571]|uniref:DUF6452 family protein n=1 Tax=Maribacter sp. 2-571 TaxID=3417569 RepID=UPI003D3572B3